MIKDVTATSPSGDTLPARVISPDEGPQVIAVRVSSHLNMEDDECLAFNLMLDPAGVFVQTTTGSVGFQMRVKLLTPERERRSTDGITLFEGDRIPEWIQLKTELPVALQFSGIELELWVTD